MLGNLVPQREWMPRPVVRFEREMDSLLRRFFGDGEDAWPLAGSEFAPHSNVAETESGFEVTVELPGMKAEDFAVELKGDQLWITGEKKEEQEEKGKTWHRMERRYGQFRRVLTLPGPVNQDQIEARFDGGVLRVSIPKTEATKPRHISIQS